MGNVKNPPPTWVREQPKKEGFVWEKNAIDPLGKTQLTTDHKVTFKVPQFCGIINLRM